MKIKVKSKLALAVAGTILIPVVTSYAGTETFVNGGNNDFVGNYVGTQNNTFFENNTTSQDNTQNGGSTHLNTRSSGSSRWRFILDFDLSSLTPYASQVTVTGAALELTQYATTPFATDIEPMEVSLMNAGNYGWNQYTSTGDYYNATTSPPTDWKNGVLNTTTGQYGTVNPPLNGTPTAGNLSYAYQLLFTQSGSDPNDYVDGNAVGTQYSITDSTGKFLSAVQGWINTPTTNGGLFFQPTGSSAVTVEYYSDIVATPINERPTLVLTLTSPTMSTDWTSDTSDAWENAADWDNGVPSTIGSSVTFGNVTSAARTVTLTSNEVVSNLTFSSPNGYTIAGSNTLSIIEVNNNLATMNVSAGNNTISAPVFWGTNTNVNVASGASMTVSGPISGGALIYYTGPGALTLGSGTSGGLTAAGGPVTVTGAMAMNGPLTLNSGSSVTLNGATTATQIAGDGTGTLNLVGGSLATTAQSLGSFSLAGLSISGGGHLDLGTNAMTINYSGTSPLATIQGYLKSGFNNGAWNGPGIITSATPTQAGTGLGYSDNGSQIKVQFTWLGDLDLNGTVDGTDLSNMGVIPTSGPNAGEIGWFDGDLNYDGVINADDWSLFQLGAFEYSALMVAPAPEPAGLAIATAGCALGLMRRRRSI